MPPTPPVITRFAPSPTGHLHIGGARTALFCWAYARRHGGSFILRIEDTDRARSSDESARGIMEDLAWLGIDWDEGPELALAGSEGGGGRRIGGDPRGVGPFFQARRMKLYNEQIVRLVELGRAYPAFESAEELEAERKQAVAAKQTYRYNRASWEKVRDVRERLRLMAKGEPHVVRFFAPHEEVVVHDEVLGDVRYAAGEMDDFVIRKGDGFPTYHFAVVVDDETMGVTHVLRAQEHLNNSPRHVALQRALSFRTPVYAHMPLICNMDGSKMSKRDKAKVARKAMKEAMARDAALTVAEASRRTGVERADLAGFLDAENDSLDAAERVARALRAALPEIEVSDFRVNGYTPGAITNFLSLLGWNPGMKTPDGKDLEKFDRAFLAAHFSLERIGKTSAKFDRAKLLSFNADALAAMSDAEFITRWLEFLKESDAGAHARVVAMSAGERAILARVVKPRAKTFRDAVRAIAFLLVRDDAVVFDSAAVEKHLTARGAEGGASGLDLLRELRGVLHAIAVWEPAAIEEAVNALVEAKGVKLGGVAQAVRTAVTGTGVSPGLGDTLTLLGRDSALRRIDRALAECR